MAVQLHYGMDHEHYDWSPFNRNENCCGGLKTPASPWP